MPSIGTPRPHWPHLEAAARFEEIINQQYNIILDRFNDGAISRTDLLMISTRKKEAELQYIKARQNHTPCLYNN